MINIQPHQIFAFDMAKFMMNSPGFSEIREIFDNGTKEFENYSHLESGKEAISLIKGQIRKMQEDRLDVIAVRDNSKYGSKAYKTAVIREEAIFDKQRALLFIANCYKQDIEKHCIGAAYLMSICDMIADGDIEELTNNL